MRDSVVIYKSFVDAIRLLSPDDQIKALNAIWDYAFTEIIDPNLDGVAGAMFAMAKPQIDANNRRYENGKRGGKPKAKDTKPEPSQNQIVTKSKPKPNQTVTKQEPNQNQAVTKPEPNVNVHVNVHVKENEKHIYGQYKHVRLTDKEYESLKKDYPNADELIKTLDEAKEMKGYTYKSDYMAIKKWVVEAVAEHEARKEKINSKPITQVIHADDLPF